MSQESLNALFQEAAALQEKGDHAGALERYEALLTKVPDEPLLLNFAACAKFELGQEDAAIDMFNRAVTVKPDYVDAWNNLGLIQQQRGVLDDALRAYNKLRELVPEQAAAHLNAANVHLLKDEFSEARQAYEAALLRAPEDPGILSALAKALLCLGEWREALDATERVLAVKPGYCGALSLRLVALQELGLDDARQALNDFDRLIDPNIIDVPDAYGDLDAFNRALCDHCLKHPSLEYERGANATRKGHHSGNLSKGDDPGPIAHLLDVVYARAQRYRDAHPVDPEHLFLAQRPDDWTYDIWCVILDDQGYQEAHVHPGGWMSGVYYAQLPDAVSDEDETHQGWIEFGRPVPYASARTEPEVRLYRPEVGKMILFPSYMYHRTVPFRSDQKRISIAFDLLPA